MQHRQVPPNLHLSKLNPHIDVEDARPYFNSHKGIFPEENDLQSSTNSGCCHTYDIC